MKHRKRSDFSEFVVKVSSAKMPNNCWGCYVHVAVLEVEDGYVPHAIDDRTVAVRRIVRRWDKCHVGTTPRSASRLAEEAASIIAARLNDRAHEKRLDEAREAHRVEGC